MGVRLVRMTVDRRRRPLLAVMVAVRGCRAKASVRSLVTA